MMVEFAVHDGEVLSLKSAMSFIDCRASGDTLAPTTVAIEGERFTGRIKGLAPGGLLRIERKAEGNKEGETIDFAFKELRYII